MSKFTFDEIVSSLIEKIVTEYNISKKDVSVDTDVLDLDVDSLDRMNYIFFLEEEFNLSVDENQIEKNGIFVIKNTAQLILENNQA
jgi:acyl carrier protein